MLHNVNPPSLEAPPHGLVETGNVIFRDDEILSDDAARDRVTTDRTAWENGVAVQEDGCYTVFGTEYDCPMPEFAEDDQECPPAAEFKPYVLQFTIDRPTTGDQSEIDSAYELIRVGTSARLEQLIFSGAAGGTNPTLDAAEDLGSETDGERALGLIANELQSAEGHVGARGTIHMSPYTAMDVSGRLIEVDGRLYTKVGHHKVVVGNYPIGVIAGHIGDIDVYLGQPQIIGDPVTIRTRNRTTFMVQRPALAVWNTCAAWVVETEGFTGS